MGEGAPGRYQSSFAQGPSDFTVFYCFSCRDDGGWIQADFFACLGGEAVFLPGCARYEWHLKGGVKTKPCRHGLRTVVRKSQRLRKPGSVQTVVKADTEFVGKGKIGHVGIKGYGKGSTHAIRANSGFRRRKWSGAEKPMDMMPS